MFQDKHSAYLQKSNLIDHFFRIYAFPKSLNNRLKMPILCAKLLSFVKESLKYLYLSYLNKHIYQKRMIKKTLFLIAIIIANSTIYAQPVLDFLGQLTYGSYEMSDVWGYADGNGNEYALVGTDQSFSIVDVTTPTNPVELHSIPGSYTYWRDIKTWQNYAYIVNEANGGMLIVDMAGLPGNISSSYWTGGNFQGNNIGLNTAHNIFIDENGYGYIVGGNSVSGAIIVDLNANPTNPPIVGTYNNAYVHDCFVRDNIMWTAEVFNGRIGIIDVSNKSNPTAVDYFSSPSNATHNCWLSDDSNYLFTTDETGGGLVGCYDVSDINNSFYVSTYSSSRSNAIPHNTFVTGNYIITSYYRDGVTLADISNPYNIVEVDEYDTSPSYNGNGFNGCWGVYPYLPSGNILATDIEEGLYILGDPNPSTGPQPVKLELEVLLEGAYNSGPGGGIMRTDLTSLLPTNQPYNVAPYNYTGTESLTNIPANMVDWVLVEARTGNPTLSGTRNTTTVETQAAILLADGSIVDTNGNPFVSFDNLMDGQDYNFCIRHRNHLDILTANSLTAVANGSLNYDFKAAINNAYGTSQQKSSGDGYAVMIAGEYTQDGTIQVTDRDGWRNEPAVLNIYDSNDGNMDGTIQVTDYDIWYPNRTKVGVAEIQY